MIDPGTPPAKRIWTSVDVGTEIFISNKDEIAEWTLSDFNVILTSPRQWLNIMFFSWNNCIISASIIRKRCLIFSWVFSRNLLIYRAAMYCLCNWEVQHAQRAVCHKNLYSNANLSINLKKGGEKKERKRSQSDMLSTSIIFAIWWLRYHWWLPLSRSPQIWTDDVSRNWNQNDEKPD